MAKYSCISSGLESLGQVAADDDLQEAAEQAPQLLKSNTRGASLPRRRRCSGPWVIRPGWLSCAGWAARGQRGWWIWFAALGLVQSTVSRVEPARRAVLARRVRSLVSAMIT
jgi:hypothetical protein